MIVFYLVCLFVSLSLHWVCFGQLLRYADEHIVNIMKVYIERRKLQVELIRHRKQFDFIHFSFCEARDSMQYRPTERKLRLFGQNHFGSVYESTPTA